jgi:hypothetical protein
MLTAQISLICVKCTGSDDIAKVAHNGGYCALDADQRELQSVTRFLARRRAERRIGMSIEAIAI